MIAAIERMQITNVPTQSKNAFLNDTSKILVIFDIPFKIEDLTMCCIYVENA